VFHFELLRLGHQVRTVKFHFLDEILPGSEVSANPNDPNSLVDKFLTFHYFIDVATSHVVMMQDVILKGVPRQIRYADFRLTNGLLVPFSISETIQGQTIRQIQLNQVTFNSGLQDSDFQL
jgi:hypothetical protein